MTPDTRARWLNRLYKTGAFPLAALALLCHGLAKFFEWLSDGADDVKHAWLVQCRRWNGQDAAGYTPDHYAEQERRRLAFLAYMRGKPLTPDEEAAVRQLVHLVTPKES